MNSVLELVAEIGDVFAEELSRLLVSVGRSIRKVSPMLGVKRDNRESVHGPKKVVLTPNIGLEDTQTRSGGSGEAK